MAVEIVFHRLNIPQNIDWKILTTPVMNKAADFKTKESRTAANMFNAG